MMRVTIDERDDGEVTVIVVVDGAETARTTVDADDPLVQRLYDAVDAFWNE